MKFKMLILALMFPSLAFSGNEKAVKSYNQLVLWQMKESFAKAKTIKELFPKENWLKDKDQKFVDSLISSSGEKSVPEIKILDQSILMNTGKYEIKIEIVDAVAGTYKINGSLVDAKSYKSLEDQARLFQRIFEKAEKDSVKHSKYLFLFQNKAHAVLPAIIAGLTLMDWVAISAAVVSTANALRVACKMGFGPCKDSGAVISSTAVGISKFADRISPEEPLAAEISCGSSPRLSLKSQTEEVFSVNSSNQNSDDSHKSIALYLKDCCKADAKGCEQAIRGRFEGRNSGLGGSAPGAGAN